jgi:hypothetical protein
VFVNTSTSEQTVNMVRPRQALSALGAAGMIGPFISFLRIKDTSTMYSVALSSLISILGFFATTYTIPVIKKRTLRAGLKGKDINKKGSKDGEKDIPESLGLAPGVVFLVRFETHMSSTDTLKDSYCLLTMCIFPDRFASFCLNSCITTICQDFFKV